MHGFVVGVAAGCAAAALVSGCAASSSPDAQGGSTSRGTPGYAGDRTDGNRASEGSKSDRTYSGTPNEWAVDVAECLREHGWDAEIYEAGPDQYGVQLASDIPDAQADDWSKDLKFTCPTEVGKPAPHKPLSEAQLTREYAYQLHARQCLIDRGQRIGDPPSREFFISNYYTDKNWGAWVDVDFEEHSQEELFALEEACPQGAPPGWRP